MESFLPVAAPSLLSSLAPELRPRDPPPSAGTYGWQTCCVGIASIPWSLCGCIRAAYDAASWPTCRAPASTYGSGRAARRLKLFSLGMGPQAGHELQEMELQAMLSEP